MNQYHQPVMKQESLQHLQLKAGGIYVDATLGGGGHSLAMLMAEPRIRLYAFDQDDEAIQYAGERLAEFREQVDLIPANFSKLRTKLAFAKVRGIDGILFDLGVSSHQIDDRGRGFGFDTDSELDMRMNRSQALTAAKLINTSSERDLCKIISEYGEELHAKRIAMRIVKARAQSPLRSCRDLSKLIEDTVSGNPKEVIKSKARVFQSLRIAVNDELEVLKLALADAINLLNPGGRIVVISYHSLEDRIVKNTFKRAAEGCICPPQILKCVCSNRITLKLISGKPLLASEEEISHNSRSRSAKMRVAEKMGK